MGDHTKGINSSPDRLRIERLTATALTDLEAMLGQSERPVGSWSGGKDAMVVCHLTERLQRGVPIYCDTGFMYDRATAEAKATAHARGWNVTFGQAQTWGWLNANRDIVFAESSARRARFFTQNHQRGIRLHADRHDADLVLFGRRTQENTVPSKHYEKQGQWQGHPIRDWTTEDVWHYLRLHGFDVPWLYTTHHGRFIGHNPFTSVRPSVIGHEDCWGYVREYDPTITLERLEAA